MKEKKKGPGERVRPKRREAIGTYSEGKKTAHSLKKRIEEILTEKKSVLRTGRTKAKKRGRPRELKKVFYTEFKKKEQAAGVRRSAVLGREGLVTTKK